MVAEYNPIDELRDAEIDEILLSDKVLNGITSDLKCHPCDKHYPSSVTVKFINLVDPEPFTDEEIDEVKKAMEEYDREKPLVITGNGTYAKMVMPSEIKTTNIFLLLCNDRQDATSLTGVQSGTSLGVLRSFFGRLFSRALRLFK